jgi:hypothetical protein
MPTKRFWSDEMILNFMVAIWNPEPFRKPLPNLPGTFAETIRQTIPQTGMKTVPAAPSQSALSTSMVFVISKDLEVLGDGGFIKFIDVKQSTTHGWE